MTDRKIDLVYLWVDGNDKKWRALKNHWQKIESGQSTLDDEGTCEARWRDNDEFRYAMRSAAKFAPWINHIYIVTCMGQKPKWLNTKNKKISIIDHSEIMPTDALPNFNATAIENCIINIPGLSEYFIYGNDDTFFGRPLTPDYFFDKDGNPIVRYHFHKKHGRQSMYTEMLYRMGLLSETLFGHPHPNWGPNHNIEPYRKSTIRDLLKHPVLDLYYQITIHNKFRNEFDLHRWIFTLYDLAKNPRKAFRVHNPKKSSRLIYNFIHRINGDFKNAAVYSTNAKKSNIMKWRPALFCINDTENTTDADHADNKEFLETMFPEKCEYEK